MDQPKPKRGLSALLAATSPVAQAPQTATAGSTVVTAPPPAISTGDIPIVNIRPNPKQPRTDFDPQALSELAASIKARGIIQPVVLRALRQDEISGSVRYEIIAGERRWRASQIAGLTAVPAVIKDVFDDRDILLLSLVENLQRDNLNPIEEAVAYDRLSKAFNLTHEQIADGVGRSRVSVTNALRMLELPSSVQDAVKAKKLSVGHAKVLLSIPDAKIQVQLGAKAQAEELSVRELELLVSGAVAASPEVPQKSRKPKPAKVGTPQVHEMERKLSEHFGTRVRIEQTLKRGRVVIEFFSVEDFERISGLMGVKD